MSVASRRLRELADTDLSYPGWEKDYEEASEACNIGKISVFERLFHQIKEKQRAFNNHHILIRIEIIEDLDILYPGCSKDKRKVEEWCRENDVNEETQEKFEEKLQGLVNKHALYSGDRSHRNLVALDKCNFSFPGWESEYENAVRAHCDEPFSKFPKLFHQMKEKQHKYEGKRIHWRLKTLDELELSYPGCEKDIAEVEAWHFNTSDSPSTASLFREAIDGLLEQEELYLEAKLKEAEERKKKEERGIFIDQRQIDKETIQTRDPIYDPVEMRTPTREELYRAAKMKEIEERKAREENERREALKRQEMLRSTQMSHSRRSINNFVQRSAQQDNEESSTHLVAPVKSRADESVASEAESEVDSVDLEVDRCYRRIAATLKMLEEQNLRIPEEIEEVDHFHPQYHVVDQHVVQNASSNHSRSHHRSVGDQHVVQSASSNHSRSHHRHIGDQHVVQNASSNHSRSHHRPVAAQHVVHNSSSNHSRSYHRAVADHHVVHNSSSHHSRSHHKPVRDQHAVHNASSNHSRSYHRPVPEQHVVHNSSSHHSRSYLRPVHPTAFYE